MKATEIRLSWPTEMAARPAVHIEPTMSEMRSAAISRPERMPMVRMMETRISDRTLAFSAPESASFSSCCLSTGTPVSRKRASG